MSAGWHELTDLVAGRDFTVAKVRLRDSDIAIEGDFELPPLARLSFEDQVFVAAFVRSHGSIKQMEELFGVSYPTVKARLNRISDKLQFVRVHRGGRREEVLAQLERGEITAREAIERLKQ